MAVLAIAAMVRNEARYLPEWLAFHALMGVEAFRIYDDGSDDDTAALLDRAGRHLDIVRIPWSGEGSLRQLLAYADACAALAGRARFVACIDADEFLFAEGGLPAALADAPDDASAIFVNQSVFGSSGLLEDDGDLVTARFVRRAETDHPEHRWGKSVVRPDCVAGFETAHNPTLDRGRRVLRDFSPMTVAGMHPGEATHVAEGRLRLRHYLLKSRAEFARKQARGAVSDHPPTGYRRLDDWYFDHREAYANVVEDRFSDDFLATLRDGIARLLA